MLANTHDLLARIIQSCQTPPPVDRVSLKRLGRGPHMRSAAALIDCGDSRPDDAVSTRCSAAALIDCGNSRRLGAVSAVDCEMLAADVTSAVRR